MRTPPWLAARESTEAMMRYNSPEPMDIARTLCRRRDDRMAEPRLTGTCVAHGGGARPPPGEPDPTAAFSRSALLLPIWRCSLWWRTRCRSTFRPWPSWIPTTATISTTRWTTPTITAPTAKRWGPLAKQIWRDQDQEIKAVGQWRKAWYPEAPVYPVVLKTGCDPDSMESLERMSAAHIEAMRMMGSTPTRQNRVT
jgi:hypothetical protein